MFCITNSYESMDFFDEFLFFRIFVLKYHFSLVYFINSKNKPSKLWPLTGSIISNQLNETSTVVDQTFFNLFHVAFFWKVGPDKL